MANLLAWVVSPFYAAIDEPVHVHVTIGAAAAYMCGDAAPILPAGALVLVVTGYGACNVGAVAAEP